MALLLGPAISLAGRLLPARRGFGLLLPSRLSATAARMRSFKAASLTLSPWWMSMARLTFPSRLELNRRAGSFNAAPLAKVILTTHAGGLGRVAAIFPNCRRTRRGLCNNYAFNSYILFV